MKRELSLLLVFTILLFSSFYFIVPVSGATTDSQEESFISTPLPLWDDDSLVTTISFTDNTVVFHGGVWGLENWTERIYVIIDGGNGAGIDYQVNIPVTFLGGMQADFDDIRFTDNDGETPLDFWLESYIASTSAVFWVEVLDNLDTDKFIFMYWGNDDVSSISNGDNTFLLFDNFTTLNADKWSWSANVGVTAGIIHIGDSGSYANRYLKSDDTFGDSVSSSALSRNGGAQKHNLGFATTVPNAGAQTSSHCTSGDGFLYEGNEDSPTSVTIPSEVWYIETLRWVDGYAELAIDRNEGINGDEITESDVDYPSEAKYVGANTWGSANDAFEMDWYFIRNWIIDEPSFNSFSDVSTIDVKIPIERYKNIKIETMIDTNDLQSNISFRFKGIEESNFKVTYISNTQTLYFDSDSYNVSAENLLRFTFELKYSTNQFTCKIKDDSDTQLKTFSKYTDVYKLNYLFCLNSSSFDGLMRMYYLSGDLDYKGEWNREIDNQDSQVYQTDFSTSVFSTEDILHSSMRSLFVSGFQFWRSELGFYLFYEDYEKSTNNDKLIAHHEITFQFYYPNGTKLYRIVFFVNATGETQPIYIEYHTDVFVYYHDELIWSCPRASYWRVPIDLYDGEMKLDSKVAIWRTQEDNLALKVNGDMNYYLTGVGKDNFTYWQSDVALKNYQCNISVYYEIETEGLDTFNVDIIHSYAEYSYNTLDGCVEPHFSTTWWEDIPVINAIINGFIWVGNMIVSGLGAIFSGVIAGAVSLLSPLIAGVTNAVNAVAGAVWALFSGAIAGITGAVNAVAGGIWALFSATLGVISSGIGDIVSGMTGWVSDAIEATLIFVLEEGLGTLLSGLIDAIVGVLVTITDAIGGVFGIANLGTSLGSFFSMFSSTIGAFLTGFGMVINYAVSAITLVATYITLFAPSGLTILGIFIIIDITDALLDNKFYKFEKYLNFLQWSLDIMFKIVNAVVQFIGGVIP